ncbi:MAG: phosphoserine phosphatase SerB [Pseudomonadota bacterium]
MTHVCTLIGARSSRAVTEDTVTLARGALPNLYRTQTLSAEVACDLFFEPGAGDSGRDWAADVRRALGSAPVDVAVQDITDRKKSLFLADMDSTMIEQECIDELADMVGIKDQVAGITERAMRGELDFEAALKDRVQLLAGLPSEAIEEVYETRVSFSPGGRELIKTLTRQGIRCVLVSGGFRQFTAKVAAALGFHSNHANELLVENGKLAGKVAEPILGREAKLEQLGRHCKELGVSPNRAIAIGDGANDLAMIEAAGLGIAYRAKPAVRARADIQLNHADLTGVLFALGYSEAEISRD